MGCRPAADLVTGSARNNSGYRFDLEYRAQLGGSLIATSPWSRDSLHRLGRSSISHALIAAVIAIASYFLLRTPPVRGRPAVEHTNDFRPAIARRTIIRWIREIFPESRAAEPFSLGDRDC